MQKTGSNELIGYGLPAGADLRRGLLQTGDDVLAFVSGPITLLFLGLSVLSLALPFIQARRTVKNADA